MCKLPFRILMLPLVLLMQTMNAGAQQHPPLSAHYSQARFDQFVKGIESGSSYHFYYDPPAIDSLIVSIDVTEVSVESMLDHIFIGTSFHYFLDSLGNIYVTGHAVISGGVPPDFFSRINSRQDSLAAKERNITGVSKINIKGSLENRLFEIGAASSSRGKATIVGYIRDAKNGEALSGAGIYVDSLSTGVVSDRYGYYTLILPKGRHVLQISSVGMKSAKRQVLLRGDGNLNIDLVDNIPSLKEVVIMAQRNSNTRGLQMGENRLTIKTIKQVPVVFGEADVLKVLLTLPGVTSVGEASNGYNVRGGSTDQNLILLNDATIYNPSHLFGFFSAFNADIIKEVQLYKTAIPEKYGGRLSSVLDVTTREGNNKKITATGGIGPLTGKITIEGPVINEKTTFLVSARSSYSNWLLRSLPNNAYNRSSASFSDIDFHISHTVDPHNSIYLNGYWSNDQFRLDNDTVYKYGNRNANIKWKHNFNNKFFNVLTAGLDEYKYSVSSTSNPVNGYKLGFNILQSFLRSDFSWSVNDRHLFKFGLNSILYHLTPGTYLPEGNASLVIPDRLQQEQALESALYFGDEYTVSPKLSVNMGIRYSVFNYLGPHNETIYKEGIPKDPATAIDSLSFGTGKIIKTYSGPELRFMARYSLKNDASVKLSFNTLRQYIHMISNTAAISPTDIWKLSDNNIKPQYGNQISLGYYKDVKKQTIETSLEIYYKHLENYLDYKSGAMLTMNHHLETDVMPTRGKAYGAEIMIRKNSGKLNGWVSYTYSRILLQANDSAAGEIINSGHYYAANYDKPHNINLITNYRFTHRYSVSLNFIYNTGRPITLPIAIFNLAGAQRVYYSDRNQYRIPDYFRSDISVNIESNHKIRQLAHNSWSIGVYNITARKNAYSVYFIEENGIVRGYKLSIFGTAIPFITYNFRF